MKGRDERRVWAIKPLLFHYIGITQAAVLNAVSLTQSHSSEQETELPL